MRNSSDNSRQALGREYFQLLERLTDCLATAVVISRNASHKKSVKEVTDIRIRDLLGLLEVVNSEFLEVMAQQLEVGGRQIGL